MGKKIISTGLVLMRLGEQKGWGTEVILYLNRAGGGVCCSGSYKDGWASPLWPPGPQGVITWPCPRVTLETLQMNPELSMLCDHKCNMLHIFLVSLYIDKIIFYILVLVFLSLFTSVLWLCFLCPVLLPLFPLLVWPWGRDSNTL